MSSGANSKIVDAVDSIGCLSNAAPASSSSWIHSSCSLDDDAWKLKLEPSGDVI